MKNTLITLAFAATLSCVARAQTVNFTGFPDGAGGYSSSGRVQKTSTGEIFNWSLSGSGGGQPNGSYAGFSQFTWELTFDKPFELSDFSILTIIGEAADRAGDGFYDGLFSVSGGTATRSSIIQPSTGTYNSSTGEWSTPTGTSQTWSATGSLGTFTTLSFSSAANTPTNDRQTSYARVNGFTSIPVPEPSSTALLGLGALGLLIRRKR